MDTYILPDDCVFYCEDCAPNGADSYPDGGGEADHPQHCDGCGCFLENPLTTEGMDFVREEVALNYRGNNAVVSEWAEFYGIRQKED